MSEMPNKMGKVTVYTEEEVEKVVEARARRLLHERIAEIRVGFPTFADRAVAGDMVILTQPIAGRDNARDVTTGASPKDAIALGLNLVHVGVRTAQTRALADRTTALAIELAETARVPLLADVLREPVEAVAHAVIAAALARWVRLQHHDGDHARTELLDALAKTQAVTTTNVAVHGMFAALNRAADAVLTALVNGPPLKREEDVIGDPDGFADPVPQEGPHEGPHETANDRAEAETEAAARARLEDERGPFLAGPRG